MWFWRNFNKFSEFIFSGTNIRYIIVDKLILREQNIDVIGIELIQVLKGNAAGIIPYTCVLKCKWKQKMCAL